MNVRSINLENPLLVKELRSRMRGAKAYWMLFAYLTILSLALLIAYFSWWSARRYSGEAFVIGRTFFQTLFFVQVGLVCLIAPGLTSGCITIEKEQRTFDLLAVTSMTARSMVAGKLVSAMSFVLLLIVSSLPLVSVCFLLGGVSPGEVFFAYLILLLAAFLYGSIGLMWSSVARNTSTATLATYGSVMGIFYFTAILGFPFMGAGVLKAVNPATAFLYSVTPEKYFGFLMPAWIPSLVLNGLGGMLLAMISVRRIDSYAADESVGLRVQSLLLYFAVLFFVFGGIFGAWQWREAKDYQQSFLMATSCLILSFLLAAIPVYATGEPAKRSNRGLPELLLYGWRRIFRSTVESSIPFISLLIIVGLAISLLGFPLSRLSPPSNLASQMMPMLLVIISVSAAWSLVAILLSYLLRSRWPALASTYLIMVVFTVLPLMTLTSWRPGFSGQHNPLWLTLYANPYLALIDAYSTDLNTLPDPSGHWIPYAPITFCFYVLIALLAAVWLRHILRNENTKLAG